MSRKALTASKKLHWLAFGLMVWLGLALAPQAAAYVGPGAGFALLSSFLVIFTTVLLAIVAFLAWPFRMLWRMLRQKKRAKPHIRRFIVVGLDGQDPRLTDRFMQEGKLPNFERLSKQGTYSKLRTTFPSV